MRLSAIRCQFVRRLSTSCDNVVTDPRDRMRRETRPYDTFKQNRYLAICPVDWHHVLVLVRGKRPASALARCTNVPIALTEIMRRE